MRFENRKQRKNRNAEKSYIDGDMREFGLVLVHIVFFCLALGSSRLLLSPQASAEMAETQSVLLLLLGLPSVSGFTRRALSVQPGATGAS